MASLSEIIQLCRLCLVKDHVNISIFDDPENVRQIPLKISSCLPVKISRDDNLPKKICDGCSSKLDLCYDFWTSTAQAEKTLLCMAKEKENQVPEAVIPQPLLLKVEPAESLEETQICEPPVPKPIIVKKEVEPAPTSIENEAEEPAAKRPRRSAAIKAQMQIAPESDDDDAAEGLCTTEDVADVEDDIEDPDIPDMNVEIDDVKPGPSGLNQRSADSEFFFDNEFDPLAEIEDELEALLDEAIHIVDADRSSSLSEDVDLQLANPSKGQETASQERPTVAQFIKQKKLQSEMYCTKCGLFFTIYENYEQHILSNPSHHSFSCWRCDRIAKSWQELKLHGKKSHGAFQFALAENQTENRYFCHFCGQLEVSIQQISSHIQEKHFKWMLKCPLCPEVWNHPELLFTHFKLGHSLSNNVSLICKECQYTFYDPSAYTNHISMIHLKKPETIGYPCVLCSSELTGESEFLRHVQQHGNYQNKLIENERPGISMWKKQCFICSRTYPTRDDLNFHLKKIHFNGGQCPLCKAKVISHEMYCHLKDIHQLCLNSKVIPAVNKIVSRQDVCEVCYAVFDVRMYAKHLEIHEKGGTIDLQSQNQKMNRIPDDKHCTKCRECNLKVVSTFLKWHRRVHDKEKLNLEKKPLLKFEPPPWCNRETSKSEIEFVPPPDVDILNNQLAVDNPLTVIWQDPINLRGPPGPDFGSF